MQLGMVGLGRMGANMTERLRAAGHDLKTFDPNVESRTAASLEELAIPGKPFGFRRFIRSQAEGDYESLKTRGRRVARVVWEA